MARARGTSTGKKRGGRKAAARERTLTQELAALLRRLLPDLSERAQQPGVDAALRERYRAERDRNRTAEPFEKWVEHTIEQVGAAWLLSCVFVRVLEDRGLMPRRRIAGEGALDSQQHFFELWPGLTERDYVLTVFRELGEFRSVADVFGPAHNPAWMLGPSNDLVREFLALLRETRPDGTLRFTFGGLDTRFLGDLYQDLSEGVRARYALLQTPDFVEKFILDRTLEPAIREFGLERVRVLDPTCGSGHFLLGAFARLYEHSQRKKPGLDEREHANRALAQVYGTDVNPYAVAIARFRLTLAYLERAGFDSLRRAPELHVNLAVADSLLHEAGQMDFAARSADAAWGARMFELDDEEAAKRILGQKYHAVVGNPPYITCKDHELVKQYRKRYTACYRQFSLAAPFTERFFELAEDRGFVGMINANSFMKREFGKALIEKVLPRYELTHVIDTSGAYIPGHGTPTVILIGRNHRPIADHVRAVLGKRGEPGTPAEPDKGVVWSSIAMYADEPGFDNEFISVVDMPRTTLAKHPWSLGGGGAADLKELLESRGSTKLGEKVELPIGRAARIGSDEAFCYPEDCLQRSPIKAESWRILVTGESVRDWSVVSSERVIFPYDTGLEALRPNTQQLQPIVRALWPLKVLLEKRATFQGVMADAELEWYEYMQYTPSANRTPLSIAFAEVATHNHFVLDRGGKVFKQTAPIIKLPDTATEDDHLALVAYLNSSTACFWMKQVCHKKSAASQKHHTDPARAAYQFSSTPLHGMPIPAFDRRLLVRAAKLEEDSAARRAQWLSGADFRAAIGKLEVSKDALAAFFEDGWRSYDHVTAQAVYVQEEIDWHIYASVGLLDDMQIDLDNIRATPLGSRPFEHSTGYHSGVSERARETDEAAPQISVSRPAHWERRIVFLSKPEIALIESPEFKRMWRDTERNVDQREFRHALTRSWVEDYLLDMLEDIIAQESTIQSTAQLRSGFSPSMEALWTGAAAFLGEDPAALLVRLVAENSVPYLAALRFTASGLNTHSRWQETWDLQRREDAGENVGDIPVPQKYGSKDYRETTFWRLRGKLDVPKERFISYPGAEGDDDSSPLVGWAGWNHLQRAQALATLYMRRKDREGWPRERLAPLLAGLVDLLPWLKQWHNQPDPEFYNYQMGDYYADFVAEQARSLRLTLDELAAWQPPARAGRRTRHSRVDSEEA